MPYLEPLIDEVVPVARRVKAIAGPLIPEKFRYDVYDTFYRGLNNGMNPECPILRKNDLEVALGSEFPAEDASRIYAALALTEGLGYRAGTILRETITPLSDTLKLLHAFIEAVDGEEVAADLEASLRGNPRIAARLRDEPRYN